MYIFKIIGFIIKFYSAILIFRLILSRQEMTFNPVGRMVAKYTDPLFSRNNRAKSETDKFIPLFIVLLFIIYAFLLSINYEYSIKYGLISSCMQLASFLSLFFITCIIVGAMPANLGSIQVYCHRLGSLWIKPVRKIFPVKSNRIVPIAIVLIIIIYSMVTFLVQIPFTGQYLFKDFMMQSTTKIVLYLMEFLKIYSYILIARVLMSWISPDPRNPIVQIIYFLTEIVLAPLRRVLPPFGMFDLSPVVAFFLIYVLQRVLYELLYVLRGVL